MLSTVEIIFGQGTVWQFQNTSVLQILAFKTGRYAAGPSAQYTHLLSGEVSAKMSNLMEKKKKISDSFTKYVKGVLNLSVKIFRLAESMDMIRDVLDSEKKKKKLLMHCCQESVCKNKNVNDAINVFGS